LDYLQDKWGTETEWDELVLEFFALVSKVQSWDAHTMIKEV